MGKVIGSYEPIEDCLIRSYPPNWVSSTGSTPGI